MGSSILKEELADLQAKIAETEAKIDSLEAGLLRAEAELERYYNDRPNFDAVIEVCNSLDKLDELEVAEFFWQGLSTEENVSEHLERVRDRIAEYEVLSHEVEEKRQAIIKKIDMLFDDLSTLNVQVFDAHARDERHQEELVVERELSHFPERMVIMPWSREGESERLFRRALLIAMLISFFFGFIIPMINVPIPDRTTVKIPERLAKLVKNEPPIPKPVRKKEKKEENKKEENKKEREDKEKPKEKKQESLQAKKQSDPAPAAKEAKTKAARKKAESTGVLAFKSSFADLMDEVPIAKVGAEARLAKNSSAVPGKASTRRSLVATQAQGGGDGIGNVGVSRNVGNGDGGTNGEGLGGVGFARVASAVADLVAEEGRPVSDGPGPARTDEEIQIIFDRYKAVLYRIYNKELRKNPTLRGKMLLRITIDPGGEVSMCKVESTDLKSPELVALITARVEKFNFGAKEGVPKTTILYPIDFLPAG